MSTWGVPIDLPPVACATGRMRVISLDCPPRRPIWVHRPNSAPLKPCHEPMPFTFLGLIASLVCWPPPEWLATRSRNRRFRQEALAKINNLVRHLQGRGIENQGPDARQARGYLQQRGDEHGRRRGPLCALQLYRDLAIAAGDPSLQWARRQDRHVVRHCPWNSSRDLAKLVPNVPEAEQGIDQSGAHGPDRRCVGSGQLCRRSGIGHGRHQWPSRRSRPFLPSRYAPRKSPRPRSVSPTCRPLSIASKRMPPTPRPI